MGEKFFIITDDSPHKKEYLEYLGNRDNVRKIVKDFFEKYNINSKKYFTDSYSLCVEGTKENNDKFSFQMCKRPCKNGLYKFKVTSSIGKAWANLKVNVINYPHVLFWFDNLYKARYNLFKLDENVYFYLDTENNIEIPKGFLEIKGSEYYKIIEDWEEKESK